jgi:hypothetical protein
MQAQYTHLGFALVSKALGLDAPPNVTCVTSSRHVSSSGGLVGAVDALAKALRALKPKGDLIEID